MLEKKFWYRKSLDGWEGLVSEPVKIHWKKGNDLTGGMTDAAYKLYEAKKKAATSSNGNSKGKETELPEYKELAAMIEESEDPALSFFAWFGFVSGYKWVSAEESEEATKKEAEKLAKQRRGEKVEDDDEDDEDQQDYQETEVFPTGDQLAAIIAEDMWPSAIKYYKQAHDADDEDLSDLEIEEMSEASSDEEVDIRSLVGKGRKDKKDSDSPPSKKQRKA